MATMLLAHTHPAVRAWVRAALAHVQEVSFVAEARANREVSCLIRQVRWDVALISCSLLDALLVEAAGPPWAGNDDVRVVVLGAPDGDGPLYRLWRAGALGYIPEDAAPEAIVEAVQAATQGQRLWTEEQIAQAQHWWDEVGAKLEALTKSSLDPARKEGRGPRVSRWTLCTAGPFRPSRGSGLPPWLFGTGACG